MNYVINPKVHFDPVELNKMLEQVKLLGLNSFPFEIRCRVSLFGTVQMIRLRFNDDKGFTLAD